MHDNIIDFIRNQERNNFKKRKVQIFIRIGKW